LVKIEYSYKKLLLNKMSFIYIDEWVQPEEAVDTSNLSPGDGVKLKNNLKETFWVTFEGTFDEDYLFGKVDSHLCNGSEYNHGDVVLFKTSDVRGISNDQTRQAQLAFMVQLVLLFEQKMGRRPTVEEIDLLTTM
jgi:hypothetical protein